MCGVGAWKNSDRDRNAALSSGNMGRQRLAVNLAAFEAALLPNPGVVRVDWQTRNTMNSTKMATRTAVSHICSALALAIVAAAGCNDRAKQMAQAVGDIDGPTEKAAPIPDPGPSHPLRDQLAPVLEKVYPLNKIPRVIEADIDIEGEYKYELEPGIAPVVRFASGLSKDQQVESILLATAEADAWAFREDARHDYAKLIHRVKRGFGDDQRDRILKAYAHLRLLQFFNSAEVEASIAALPNDLRAPVIAMRERYTNGKEQVWNDWMDVKMYARRVVAGDEPFRSVLRGIKKELGKEEPPPRTWMESMDGPFVAWAKQIEGNDELLIKLTNYRDLREREEFMNDTHSLWVVEGSAKLPDKARGVKVDKSMGFAAIREDLGGGYNDMTYVFARGLSGSALKKAFLRSVIYGQLLHDFQMLSTAGSDFAKRTEDNVIDSTTSVVPDKYDPLYAKCGSAAAIDTFIAQFSDKFGMLADLRGSSNPDKILNVAHDCVIDGARGEIHIPAKDDDKDVEGPAPGSRLNLARMGGDEKTEEDELIEDQEAVLKQIKAQRQAGG
jgi:hypothetical protein